MEDREIFRIFFLQKLAILLLALPFLGALLAVSPVTAGWSRTVWFVVGAAAGLGVAGYVWKLWRTSAVVLRDEGLTLHVSGGLATWPYARLLKVSQFGRYRVKMCFDPGAEGKHYHIKLDLFDADAFVDALLDRYAETQGRELPAAEELPRAA